MIEIKNYAITIGKAEIKNGEVIFKEILDKKTPEKNVSRVQLRTEHTFSNGTIEFKAKFKDSNSGCVVGLRRKNGDDALVGCSKDASSFIVPNKEGYMMSGALSTMI